MESENRSNCQALQPRRHFLQRSLAASLAGWTIVRTSGGAEIASPDLHIAPFRFDVTPPIGHSCCGGWIKPVEAVDDPLEAMGFVLLGAGKPIVLCAVDWTGLLNEAHVAWRTALAEGAGTTPDRVAVHCVHQHNAPFACLETERLTAEQGDLPHVLDVDFFRRCLDRGRQTVAQEVGEARRVTRVAAGQAKVDQVASNRRVKRDESGRVLAMRGSSCTDEALRALPEGLIDPWLKTVAFYDGPKKIVACHYYAVHPMSYYGDGRVTSDFAGLARKARQEEDPGALHVYFTGCAGNIAAGKYNDGSHAVRPILTSRIKEAMVRAETELRPEPAGPVSWNTVEILPPPRDTLSAESLAAQTADKSASVANRSRPAFMLSWLLRQERRIPIVLSSLSVSDISLVHFPSECFIEYQLEAQQVGQGRFVAVAAYGDGGPWYIPVREEYPHGGYEVSVAFCDPKVDDLLSEAMRQLLNQPAVTR
jgi:hypothetical protein